MKNTVIWKPTSGTIGRVPSCMHERIQKTFIDTCFFTFWKANLKYAFNVIQRNGIFNERIVMTFLTSLSPGVLAKITTI